MFFRKDPPQTEGRRDAHPGIKTEPVSASQVTGKHARRALTAVDAAQKTSTPPPSPSTAQSTPRTSDDRGAVSARASVPPTPPRCQLSAVETAFFGLRLGHGSSFRNRPPDEPPRPHVIVPSRSVARRLATPHRARRTAPVSFVPRFRSYCLAARDVTVYIARRGCPGLPFRSHDILTAHHPLRHSYLGAVARLSR